MGAGNSHDAQLFRREQKLVTACKNAHSVPVPDYLETVVKILISVRPSDRNGFLIWKNKIENYFGLSLPVPFLLILVIEGKNWIMEFTKYLKIILVEGG